MPFQIALNHQLGNRGATVPTLSISPIPNPKYQGSSAIRRWALLHKIKNLCRPDDPAERGPAVCGCGCPASEDKKVNVHLRVSGSTGEIRAGVSGVLKCGSSWLCPVCAVGKAKERAEKIQIVADAVHARGGRVVLIVLTASHDKKTPLKDIMTLIQTASGKARKGRAWIEAKNRFGILGVVCGQEVTFSLKNGWHYHQHLSVLIDGPGELSAEETSSEIAAQEVATYSRASEAGEWVIAQYKDKIRAAGGRVDDHYGCFVRVAEDANDSTEYTAKGSMAWEVSGGYKDKTRSGQSLTPWDLATAAYEGNRSLLAKWHEYAIHMPGTRTCVVSAALAKILSVYLDEDETEGDEQQLNEKDDIVGQITAPIWLRWLRHGLASTFLCRVEETGQSGFATAVEQTDAESNILEAHWLEQKAKRDLAIKLQKAASDAERNELLQKRRLRNAAREVSQCQDSVGMAQHIKSVVERMNRDDPEAPTITSQQILSAVIAAQTEPALEREDLEFINDLFRDASAFQSSLSTNGFGN